MKVITKTTAIIGTGKTVAPGELIDLDKDEALGLIKRGLVELPSKAVVDTPALEGVE